MNKNSARAAEGRSSAASGLKYAVLAVLVEGGAAEDNEALAPIFSSVHELEHHRHLTGEASGSVSGAVDPIALLPPDYASKFYTYAGSLTTPPCSQQVTVRTNLRMNHESSSSG